MPRRLQLGLYVFLSIVDFASTTYLVGNGFADEANPLINGFTALFTSFPSGLAIYKILMLTTTVLMLRAIHRSHPRAANGLLIFANLVMLGLGAWHINCIRISLIG